MPQSGTDPESYLTEHTLVYEDQHLDMAITMLNQPLFLESVRVGSARWPLSSDRITFLKSQVQNLDLIEFAKPFTYWSRPRSVAVKPRGDGHDYNQRMETNISRRLSVDKV